MTPTKGTPPTNSSTATQSDRNQQDPSPPRIVRETRHFHLDYSSGIKVTKSMSQFAGHRDRTFFHRSIYPQGSNAPSQDDALVFSQFTRSIQFTDNTLYLEWWFKHHGADGSLINESRSACYHDANGLISNCTPHFITLNEAQNNQWRDDSS